MAAKVFGLSLDDGLARPLAKLKTTATELRWTEEVLQHVLVLNPALLGVEDHLPLAIDGSSHEVTADQAYVDEVGRLVLVEVKNEKADLKAMAQLLAYSEHWSLLPLGEADRAYRYLQGRGSRDEMLGSALSAVRGWARVRSQGRAPSGRSAAEWNAWPIGESRTVTEFARTHWGEHALGLSGAPPRKVLIAPDFDQAVLAFSGELVRRYVPIELIRADLRRDEEKGIVLSWEPVVGPPDGSTATWDAARRIWRLPEVRRRFSLNAWADNLSRSTFSFSAQHAPGVKLWIEQDGKAVSLSTVVPDGWFKEDARARKALRKAVIDRWPPDCSTDRWFGCSFHLPKEEAAFKACAVAMADALCDILVPLASQFG